MKILSNKKYNELILKSCKGMFGAVTDDMLLRENALLNKENKQLKEVIDKVNKKLNNFIDCCKAEKLESGSDYIHHQYWDMFERFNKQIKDILKEVE